MNDEEIERVVREYAHVGHVLFEGLFISNSVGRWKNLAAELRNVTWLDAVVLAVAAEEYATFGGSDGGVITF